MNDSANAPTGFSLCVLTQRVIGELERIPYSVIALGARIFPAAVFWQSGQTKVEGWRVSENAIYLFKEDYKLPLLDPTVAAHLAAVAEHVFPALLILGLASRLSAAALLAMTLVIEIFVYPDAWPTHGVWATCLLLIVARGPGVLSLDHLLPRRCARA
ncbi:MULTISPECIES: DoxX family protein [Methylosinus]|uniref:DoxX family protein n=1 Tax=Methylosinus sporium TaxID=428 RepID=A0A2U1SNA0_METSR|nr:MULTISPECIES: DoxX family protein [Methylosinus]MBU3890205.1 DoxX family protein [Methylosinus sp. KRF6]PWB93076.1 DoxX family protein [Methylosinus sporium]TRL38276.1 DoxX family protein [Methylosinus sporium]